MKISTKLLIILPVFLVFAACSPPELPTETLLDGQRQTLDKAKNVEKIGLDYKQSIDNRIDQASKD